MQKTLALLLVLASCDGTLGDGDRVVDILDGSRTAYG
jgi:hypothetical protein